MKLATRFCARHLFIGFTWVLMAGCGDDVLPSTDPSGLVTGLPPPAPNNAALPDGPGATFAISNIKLGRNAPDGTVDKEMWKFMGYNLDRTVTTRTSAGVVIGDNVCARVEGASVSVVMDGEAGRDNGFGSTLMPIIMSVNSEAEKGTNDYIRQGNHTLLFEVQGLGQSRTYQSLSARIYEGRSFVDAQGMAAMPKFDGTDVWPIAFESVDQGNLDAPRAKASNAYVADEGDGGTFVGHFDGSILLTVNLFGYPSESGALYLRVHEPLVTMRLSADRLRVESGTLAGFISTIEIDDEVRRLVGLIDKMFCNSSTSESLRREVRRSSDILRGGERVKTKPCDSISLAVEFEAARAQLGTVVAPAAPPPENCLIP